MLINLGLNQALFDFTMKLLENPDNHQCYIYYVNRRVNGLLQSSYSNNCLDILKLCFEEERAREIETYLVHEDLLKHQNLEYWIYSYLDNVNYSITNSQNKENNTKKKDEWWSGTARTPMVGLGVSLVSTYLLKKLMILFETMTRCNQY